MSKFGFQILSLRHEKCFLFLRMQHLINKLSKSTIFLSNSDGRLVKIKEDLLV
jgi:hypothetical protein